MQSKVYQAFREEERKEIEENRFAQVAMQQSAMLKNDFKDLNKNYAQLQKIVHDQLAETKKLEKEAKEKNKALHQIEVSKEDIESQIKAMQLNATAAKAKSAHKSSEPPSKSIKSTNIENSEEPAADSLKEK